VAEAIRLDSENPDYFWLAGATSSSGRWSSDR
jgi:hypothetical protein